MSRLTDIGAARIIALTSHEVTCRILHVLSLLGFLFHIQITLYFDILTTHGVLGFWGLDLFCLSKVVRWLNYSVEFSVARNVSWFRKQRFTNVLRGQVIIVFA